MVCHHLPAAIASLAQLEAVAPGASYTQNSCSSGNFEITLLSSAQAVKQSTCSLATCIHKGAAASLCTNALLLYTYWPSLCIVQQQLQI
jgi:hypothetical protein